MALRGVPRVFVGHFAVEPFRVEVAADPPFGITVLGIVDFEEAGIAVDAANILGWSGTRTMDASGSARRRVEGREPFELDDVFPVVAEVIDVKEAEPFAAVEVAQPYLALVETAGRPGTRASRIRHRDRTSRSHQPKGELDPIRGTTGRWL